MTAREIRLTLEKEGFDRIPSVRSIENILADYRRISSDQQDRDHPVDPLHLDRIGLPAESLQVIMEATARLVALRREEDADMPGESYQGKQTQGSAAFNVPLYGQLTGRAAYWLWWVHNAAPDMDIEGKIGLGIYLASADLAQTVYGETWDTRWVVSFLALKPWTGPEARAAFNDAVRRGLVVKPPDGDDVRATLILLEMRRRGWGEPQTGHTEKGGHNERSSRQAERQ